MTTKETPDVARSTARRHVTHIPIPGRTTCYLPACYLSSDWSAVVVPTWATVNADRYIVRMILRVLLFNLRMHGDDLHMFFPLCGFMQFNFMRNLCFSFFPFSCTFIQWCRNEFEYGGAPVRCESGGRAPPENFFGRFPPLYGSKSTIVVIVSTVRSVFCLLFFYSRCPRDQPFVKVGARAPVRYGVGATTFIFYLSSFQIRCV